MIAFYPYRVIGMRMVSNKHINIRKLMCLYYVTVTCNIAVLIIYFVIRNED